MAEPREVRRVVVEKEMGWWRCIRFPLVNAGVIRPDCPHPEYFPCTECPEYSKDGLKTGDIVILYADNTVKLVKAGEAKG
jgi:hypothetical protein